MSVERVTLLAPLSGWALPLREVPDPVFAQGMAGDGVAIDPTSAEVLAPCAGEVVLLPGARHAVTIRDGALEVMVHAGIDTVKLGGAGFTLLVRAGERVTAAQPLLRIDLDRVARAAPSLVTPILVAAGGRILSRVEGRRVVAGEPCLEIEREGAAVESDAGDAHRRTVAMPFEHGLHVRPAAQVVTALKAFRCEVSLRHRDRTANARSTVAMMTLGARQGETVEIIARGSDAPQALAALLALFEAQSPAAARGAAVTDSRGRIAATIASRGFAVGPAAPWALPEIPVEARGRDPATEHAALMKGLDAVVAYLEAAAAETTGESRAVLGGHATLAQDPELQARAAEHIARGASAGHAWRQASRETARQLEDVDDARMRERAADLRDLESQVLRVLGGESPRESRRVAAGSIVIADELLPSQVLALVSQGAAGACLARGGATSHAAILAAANGLPMLVAAGDGVLAIAAGTALVLDAEQGMLEIDPPAARLASLGEASASRAAERASDLASAGKPAVTGDGLRIAVMANLGGASEVEAALRQGAEGCGLLRTEFLFLDRGEAPSEAEQRAEYQRIAASLGGRPVAIRTMDVGGDKPLPYLPMPREDNPALGLRGVRASLRDPSLLRDQLRAIAGVTPTGVARVLLPMVTELDELLRVRSMLAEIVREAGRPMPALGVMIETPASALLATQLASVADFLSIGTNDLSQYTLAIDRGHAELARSLDALHPAVLRLIAMTVEGAKAHGRSVSVCGALAGDDDALPILIGLGVRELSATSAVLPRIKRRIRALEAAACARAAAEALSAPDAASVRLIARGVMAPSEQTGVPVEGGLR
jgi:phosphoenolpyruvate-protein phosphotransferase